MSDGTNNPVVCPNIARLAQKGGPVEPGLMFPAFDFASLNWRRVLKALQMVIARVEPQAINSIMGASEKWSIIPARCTLVGGWSNMVDVDATPWEAGIYMTRYGETVRLVRPQWLIPVTQ